MFNAVIFLLACIVIYMTAFPVLLARLKDRKMMKSLKPEGNVCTVPQTPWLFTIRGIAMSIIFLAAIPVVLFLFGHYFREWLGIHIENKTKDMFKFLGGCIILVLSGIAYLIAYIEDFRKHKNDYIRLGSETLEICSENQKDSVNFSEIKKFDIEKRRYVIYHESGRKIVILKSLVNRLIGRDQLNEKLKKLSSFYQGLQ